jgi:dihydropteroate synthase
MTSNPRWQSTRFTIDLRRPQVMGIVNVTPDSFSDGGQHADAATALRHCERLMGEGAHMLDLGAESTRPGAAALSEADELTRLLPVVREAVKLGVPISVDTYKPGVMQAVLDLGVDIVNDIWALRLPGALDVVARHGACAVCLMHMHRDPKTMQIEPMVGDVLLQVSDFLQQRAQDLEASGVARQRIMLDPGIGFGKTVAQNFQLLARQRELLALGYPLLAGWSRKSALGAVTGLDVQQRLVPSVAAALLAAQRGARVLRVHDVAATVAALKILQATEDGAAYLQ